ncbi:MAG: hypothetical protein WD768_16420 [Phycisphaeraceae bacterium]
MKRLFKWLLRIVAVVGVILSIVLLVYINWLPGIAEGKIVAALKAMGIDPASARVHSVSTSHLQLTDLTIASDDANGPGLRIGSVGVDYDLSLTGNLTVKQIDVVGAVLQLNLRDGKLDLGPLADFKSKAADESDADADLPFHVLNVRSSSLLLDWEGRRFALPLDLKLTHEGKGVCAVEASVQVLGMQVPITGTIDLTAPATTTDAGTEAKRTTDGIAFTLKTVALDHALMIVGRAGGLDSTFDVAIKPVDSPDAFAGATTRLVIRRDEKAGTTMLFHIEGQPQTLGLDLAGHQVDATGFQFSVDAELDLNEPLLTLSVSSSSEQMKVASNGRTTHLAQPRFAAVIKGSFLDHQLLVTLADGDVFTFDSIQSQGAEQTTTIAGASLHAGDVALAWPLGEGKLEAMPLLRLNLSTSPLSLKQQGETGGIEAGLATLILRGELGQPGDASWPFAGSITIEHAHAKLPQQKVEVTGFSAVIPVTRAAKPRVEPSLSIDSVVWDTIRFASPTGRVSIVDGSLRGEGSWPIFENQPPMTAQGAIDLTQPSPTGKVTLRMQKVHLTDDQAIANRLRLAEGWRIKGDFDVTGEVTLAEGRLVPDVQLIVRDMSASHRKSDAAFEGIDANLNLNSLSPLATPPNQRLSAKSGHIGKLKVNNAVANFRMESPESIELNLAAWAMGDQGRFWIHACRFNPSKPVLQTQVFVEDMSISEWLELLTDQKVKGEGFIYGRLPVRVDSDRDPALTFGKGFLYAKPGKGWIEIQDGTEASAYVVKSIDDVFGAIDLKLKGYLVAAVHDYEFDRLQFDFYPQNNKLNCLVTTSGRGRTGAKAPVGLLEVNIDDFGSLLSKRILRSANAPGAIDDTLNRIFGGK